jgi:hypothetical protein
MRSKNFLIAAGASPANDHPGRPAGPSPPPQTEVAHAPGSRRQRLTTLNPIVINFPVPHGPAKAHRRRRAVGCPSDFQDALGTENGRAVDQTALAARATT